MSRAQEPEWRTEEARFVPAALDWSIVLIDTPDVVCYLDDVRVYPSSCRFQVRSLLRPTAVVRAREAFAAGDGQGPEPIDAQEAEKSLLLGVEYADGRRSALCLNVLWPPLFEDSSGFPILECHERGSAGDTADAEVALYGLPEQGSATLHASWSALGAPESVFELDGAVLRAAAGRAVRLWPADGFSSPES